MAEIIRDFLTVMCDLPHNIEQVQFFYNEGDKLEFENVLNK